MSEWNFPNAATPEGSGPYYVVRFAPRAQRDRLARVFAWHAELMHIVERANDPGVARVKVHWWREELQRCRDDTPRHPLAQALTPLLQELDDLQPWFDMLDATEADVRRLQPADAAEFADRCDRSGGALAELLACTLGALDAQERQTARRLGGYYAAANRLRDLGPHLGRRYNPAPRQSLEKAQLHTAGLHEAEPARLAAALDEALTPFADRIGALPPASSRLRALAPARRLAAQAGALHRELRRRGFPVLRQRVELTPLRLLWLSWRA